MSKSSVKDFEKSLDSLEDIVNKMEQEELSLEQSLANFKNGIKLVQKCEKAISDAKQTVHGLMDDTKTEDGSI